MDNKEKKNKTFFVQKILNQLQNKRRSIYLIHVVFD